MISGKPRDLPQTTCLKCFGYNYLQLLLTLIAVNSRQLQRITSSKIILYEKLIAHQERLTPSTQNQVLVVLLELHKTPNKKQTIDGIVFS